MSCRLQLFKEDNVLFLLLLVQLLV